MSEVQKNGDQSMDDILASIRKIISSDSNEVAANKPEQTVLPETIAPKPAEGFESRAAAVDEGQPAPTGSDDLSDFLEPTPAPRVEDAPRAGTPLEARNKPTASDGNWPFEPKDQAGTGVDLQGRLAALEPRPAKPSPKSDVSVVDRIEGTHERPATMPETIDAPGYADKAAEVDAPAPIPASAAEVPVTVQPGVVPEGTNVETKAATAQVSPAVSGEEAGAASSAVIDGATALGRMIDAGSSKPRSDDVKAGAIEAPAVEAEKSAAPIQSADQSRYAPEVAAAPVSSSNKAEAPTELEALVIKALQPVLREWMDDNLARLVEEKIEAEVARRMSEKNPAN
jgi:cell pole-organizing protein PopZ